MKSAEEKITPGSDYFIHSPSASIMETFLYPTHLGHFSYLPGYRQHRIRFDSFLIMYVMDGSLTLEYGGRKSELKKDSFALIDCYQEHCYYSDRGWEAVWIHFDGAPARKMYEMIRDRLGNVFILDDPLPVVNRMAKIYQSCSGREPAPEMLLAKYLNDLLTGLILYTPLQVGQKQRASVLENTRIYIQEHIREPLTIEFLAKKALMSPWYFIRVFKKETGMSPHEYILSYRIRLAKILLLETAMSVHDICYETGFSSESVFCAAFKKSVGCPPGVWRTERTQS